MFKRRRSTMTIMALLVGILSESRSPKTLLISLSYESHNGARLSKVDPSPRADIQKARGENTPRILRSLYSTSLMPTDKGRKGGPALTRRACIVRLCIIGRATRPDPRVIQRTIKNSALFDARVDGPRTTPSMRRRCVTRTRRRIPLGGREPERAIPIYEDRRRRGNPIPYDVRVEHVAINNLLRREGRSLCNALSLFVSYRLRLPSSLTSDPVSLSSISSLSHPSRPPSPSWNTGSFTHDVTWPPSLWNDVTINSGASRCFLYATSVHAARDR